MESGVLPKAATRLMRTFRPAPRHVIITFVALSSPNLFACECAESRVGDALKHALVAFRGTVVRIDHLNPIQPTDADRRQLGAAAGDNPVKLAPMPRTVDDHTLATFQIDRRLERTRYADNENIR